METPLQSKNPNKRRKLIKILKKKNVALQMQTSVSQVYHKKLKTAINVSLNSTRNFRTLQANNRSLASSLEKQRQNNRLLNDAYQNLLKANHVLRTKLLEMERFGYLSTSSLEKEVERRVELKMQNIKEKLNGLSTCSQAFVDIVLDLTKICSSKNTMDTSLLNSSLTSLPVLPAPSLSLDDTDIDSCEDTFKELAVYPDGFKKKSSLHEMSLIMEQSLLQPSDKSVPESSLHSLTENSSTCPRKPYSKLPQRIPKQVNNNMGNMNDDAVVSNVKSLAADISSRRATFTVAPVSPEETLLETLAPPFLLSDDSVTESIQNELQGFENLHAVSSKSPPQTEQDVQLDPQNEKFTTPSQLEKTLSTKQSDKPQNVKVKKPKSKSVKDLVKKKEKNMKVTAGFIKKDAPLIANEFALNIAYLELTKKMETLKHNPQNNCPRGPQTNGLQTEDKTILMVEDMELTMPLGKDFPNSTFSESTNMISIPANNEGSRQENEVLSEAVDGALKFPDAVTLRISKPGQFVFAASRKESDGTRKAVPVVTKSRSRSKKLTAEIMEKMQQDEPQSIFDFHEKTPTSLNYSKKILINNTATDESTPPPPLPQSQRSEKVLNSVGHEEIDIEPNKSVSSNQPPSLLGNGAEYQLPLKDSPDKPSSFNRSTRSRSRGRKLNPKSDDEIEAYSDHQLPSVLDRWADHELPLLGNPAHDAASFRSRARSKSRSRKLKTDIDEDTDVSSNHQPQSVGDEGLYAQQLDSPSHSTRSSRKRTRSKSCGRKFKNKSDDNTTVNSDHQLSSLHGNGHIEDQPLYNRRKRSVSPSRTLKPNSDKEADNQKPPSVLGDGAEYELPLKGSPCNSNTTFKTRSRSKSRSRKLKQDSGEEAESKQKSQSSLGNGAEYELPLKGSPFKNNTTFKTRTRSKSHSTKLNRDSDEEAEVDSKQKSQSLLGNGAEYEIPLKGSPCNTNTTVKTRTRSKSYSRKLNRDSDEEAEVDSKQKLLGNTNEYELPLKASPSRSASTFKSYGSRSLSRKLKANSDVEIEVSSDQQSLSALSKGAVNELPLEQNPTENVMNVRGRSQCRSQSSSNAETLESDDNIRPFTPCLKGLSAQINLSESSVCQDGGIENGPNCRYTKEILSIDNETFDSLEDASPSINKNLSPEQQIKSSISKTKKVADFMKNVSTKKTDHKLIPVKNIHNWPDEVEALVAHQLAPKANSAKSFEIVHVETEMAFSEPKQEEQSKLKVEDLILPNITRTKGNRKISPNPKNSKCLDKQSVRTNKVDNFSSENSEPNRIVNVKNALKVNQSQELQNVLASLTKGEKIHKSPTTGETIRMTATNHDEKKELFVQINQKDIYTSKSYMETATVNDKKLLKAHNHVYMRKKKAKDSKHQKSLQNICDDDVQHHTKTENPYLSHDEFGRKPTQLIKNPTFAYDESDSDTKRSLSQEMDNMRKSTEEALSSKANSTKIILKKQEKTKLASNKQSENEPNSELSPPKRLHLEQEIISSSNEPDTKRRRAATKVNYAELKLNKKLRRGDPFTSHYCTTDKLDIYKHKGNKKHLPDRNVLGSLHNQSIKEDE
ncbi:unnamed protein product [Lymnaea stagnalis]|uniref:Shugoshin C-terminal domain-containing protein n=1 Tax=Lymnaea stagnalis TaxID=6523 RepID=A0AAV2IFF5_LYMST